MPAPTNASTRKPKSKAPLTIVLCFTAVSGYIVLNDAFEHRIPVTAMDGSEHLIELDPDIIRARGPARAAAPRLEGELILPGNEVNMSGTTVR